MNNKIFPCLWFDGQAKAAAQFYCSVFEGSKITVDTPMVVNFEMGGQKFMGLNGGPKFKINPSISLFVMCETEAETETVWQKLSVDGVVLMPLDKYPWSSKYGWLQDRFGVSWQVAFGKIGDVGQKFRPLLLFTGPQHGRAEEAIRFYTSVFQTSTITGIVHYKAGETEPEGTVNHAQFSINNYVLMAADSTGPHPFNFNEAFSLVIHCKTQEEIDYYWSKLSEGGQESMCGWVQDKFGLWWQVVPEILRKLMSDPVRTERVLKAFMQMKKFDIQKLEKA